MSTHISQSTQVPTPSHERLMEEERSLERMEVKPRPSFARLGFWMAIAGAVGAILYGVNCLVIVFTVPSAITWHDYASFLASYNPWLTAAILIPPFVVTFIFPVLIFAIHQTVPQGKRSLVILALVFAGIYTAVLGMAYLLQLTFVPQSLVGDQRARHAVLRHGVCKPAVGHVFCGWTCHEDSTGVAGSVLTLSDHYRLA